MDQGGHVVDGMKCSFLIEPIAITVFRWKEFWRGEVESGCRVELQRLAVDSTGTHAAVAAYEIDDPIWRGDFFVLEGAPPSARSRAHQHMEFRDREPGGRQWDERLASDPLAWWEEQLSDISGLLRRCGVDEAPNPNAMRRAAPMILDAVRACMAPDEA